MSTRNLFDVTNDAHLRSKRLFVLNQLLILNKLHMQRVQELLQKEESSAGKTLYQLSNTGNNCSYYRNLLKKARKLRASFLIEHRYLKKLDRK